MGGTDTVPSSEMFAQVIAQSEPGAVVLADSAGATSVTGKLNAEGIAAMKDGGAAQGGEAVTIECGPVRSVRVCQVRRVP